MATIIDLSVEVLARIFEDLDLDDAWTARQVCRYWHGVFTYVAYDSANSIYLRNSRVDVDLVCGITTAKGKVPDRHIIPGELMFEATHGQMARWTHRGKKKHEFWPGGQWRKIAVGEAVVDVRLGFSNLSVSGSVEGSERSMSLAKISLGKEVTVTGNAYRNGGKTNYSFVREGKFKDFTITVDTHSETLCCRKFYDKHCITSISMPKWQIYALLVHQIQLQRHFYEYQSRHYTRTSNFQKLLEGVHCEHDILSLGIF
jgi:hypothetical protein